MDKEKKEELGKALSGLARGMKEHEENFIFEFDIKFPIEVTGVTKHRFPRHDDSMVGSLVMIRPCADEYKRKTFLGLYLGDLPLDYIYELEKKTGNLLIYPHTNPAIFVMDLNKIIWGCESWWGTIKSEEELRQITDEEINNVWYVKALKQLNTEQ